MKKRIVLTETSDSFVTEQTGSAPERVREATVMDLATAVLKRGRFIVISMFCILVVAMGVLILLPNQYTSVATILPSGTPDQISELKSLAGLGTGSSSTDNPSELFPSILRSQTIEQAVLNRQYHIEDHGKSQSICLKEYWDQDNPDKLLDKLAGVTDIAADKKTGVITLAVETEYPVLSQQIAQAYLSELESFNLYRRKSQAKENAAYLKTQVELTKIDMDKAESDLAAYLNSNRNYTESSDPELQREMGQLQRDVEIQNKKYLYLTQQYEMAKLDVQKDVPIVSTLDQPSLPTDKSSPHRLSILVMIMLAGAALLLGGVAAREVLTTRLSEEQKAILAEARVQIRNSVPFIRRPKVEVKEPETVA